MEVEVTAVVFVGDGDGNAGVASRRETSAAAAMLLTISAEGADTALVALAVAGTVAAALSVLTRLGWVSDE